MTVALQHWLQLALTEGMGSILIGRLIQTAGGAEAACAADRTLLRSAEGIGPAKSQSISESLRRACDEVEAELQRCQAANVGLVCRDDPAYPILFKAILDRQQRILLGIGDDAAALGSIIARAELPAEVVMQELTLMTLRGMVERLDGQNYVRQK